MVQKTYEVESVARFDYGFKLKVDVHITQVVKLRTMLVDEVLNFVVHLFPVMLMSLVTKFYRDTLLIKEVLHRCILSLFKSDPF